MSPAASSSGADTANADSDSENTEADGAVRAASFPIRKASSMPTPGVPFLAYSPVSIPMDRMYVCRACRESLRKPLLPSLKRSTQVRTISYSRSNDAASQSAGGSVTSERISRYSRQPLRPENLLRETWRTGELPRDRNPRREHAPEEQAGIPWHKRKKPPGPTPAQKELWAIANGEEVSAIPVQLDRFARRPSSERQEVLTTYGSKAIVKILTTLLRRWSLELFDQGDPDTKIQEQKAGRIVAHGLETPSEIIDYMYRIDLLNGTIMAWMTTKLALWSYGHPVGLQLKPGAHETLIRETLRLWYACVRKHLRPDEHFAIPDNNSAVDWSFLPSADSLMEEYRDSRLPGESDRVGEVIAQLVPHHASFDKRIREHSDFTCAALFTLGSLRQVEPRSTDLTRDPRTMFPEHRPFVDLLETIFAASASTLAPQYVVNTMKVEQKTMAHAMYQPLIDLYRLKIELPATKQDSAPMSKYDQQRNERLQPIQPAQRDLGQEDKTAKMATDRDRKTEVDPQLESEMASSDVDVDTRKWVATRIKRLGRGLEQQDLTRIEQVWREVEGYAKPLPISIYEQLMMGCLALRRPGLAIDVWNKMTQGAIEPRVHTYVVMMRGCQYAKDINAMEGLWNRMRSSGMQPDNYAWTTRIYGLFKAGLTQRGQDAMKDMGVEWLDAVREQHKKDVTANTGKYRSTPKSNLPKIDYSQYPGDVNGVPKPDVTAMNAGVTALATASDRFIPAVLTWGRSFGVEPDLTTYNALLNVSMRHGRTEEALALLERMQQKGIKPDDTTSTVLITALLHSGFLDNLSPAEQQAKILSHLSKIEDNTGTTTDTKAYALIIDRLLKTHSNPPAAQAVLNHMLSKNIQPTPHVYTILMTSYFDRSPPDFTAVENLWNQTQNTPSGFPVPLDTVFYDRMVENYARHHVEVGTGPMLMFLQRMSREGKRVSWRALEHVARALADRGDWSRLLGVVDDVRSEHGGKLVGRAGMLGMSGQRSFWRFVIETGVLEGEGVRDPEQLIMTKGGSSFPSKLGME